MSKKIDDARKKFSKARKKHAEAVGGARITLKHAERAASKLQEAAIVYATAVKTKSGLETSFTDEKTPGLDKATITSLAAERDALSKNATGPLPVKKTASK
ncbi:MAG: hypothetical protein V4479_07085 [Actinomycetota bacterium]